MTKYSKDASQGASTYKLGHSDREVQRLLLQGRIYNAHTEHALRLAGLRPGMQVLDVGCGPGDVSIVASRLVGATGSVLAVDAAADIIELARTRAAEMGASNIRFERAAIADIAVAEPVDAVIGRLILMHLPDPVAILRHLARQVRPGGLIAFCETDITLAGSVPVVPLVRAVKNGISDVFTGMGVDTAFGRRLHALFRQAGLNPPRLTLGGPLGGADDTDVLALVVDAWRSVLPMAEQLGMVTDQLSNLDTLLQRLREEVADADAVVMLPTLITAWTLV
jgi:ubiquinone/menaquinone biosynthesis C-methylase UbiE